MGRLGQVVVGTGTEDDFVPARHSLATFAHPWLTTAASTLVLGLSLLLIPSIGAEFMPHLDEGALWVRATMPYTISFD